MRMVMWQRVMAAGVVLATVACGSDEQLQQLPQFDLAVDGKPHKPATCNDFFPDSTGGQLTASKTVKITNSGGAAGDNVLCLKVKWKTDNSLLTMAYVGAKPTDEGKCPGALVALASNKTISIRIDYKPSPDIDDTDDAQLEIEHYYNDLKGGKAVLIPSTRKLVPICFGIQDIGPKICLDQKEGQFTNASAANPPTDCYSFGNCGTGALKYNGSLFDPLNGQYAVVEEPKVGDEIPPQGTPGNPKEKPTKFKVCVRYTPDTSPDNEGTNLVIKSNDKGKPNANIPISAVNQEESKVEWSGSAPNGQCEFNFQGVTAGKKESLCKLFNLGPASYTVLKMEVKAIDPALDQAVVDAIYKVEAFKGADSTSYGTGTFAVAKGKTADFVVTMQFPNSGKPPEARLVVSYSQGNVPGQHLLSVLAGKCDVPAADFGPQPEIWQQAAVGSTSKATFVVANQSCAPMQLVTACVTSGGIVGANPCGKASAKGHALVKAFASTSVPGRGLHPIDVECKPPNDNSKTIVDLLHVTYCQGAYNSASGECTDGAPVTQTINLTCSTVTSVKPPTFKLVGPDTPGKVGSPLKISGVFTQGTQPSGKNFLWVITSRPSSSLAWLPLDVQSTSTPVLWLLPDAAGKYEVAGMAQAIDENDAGNYSWSKQVFVTVEVK